MLFESGDFWYDRWFAVTVTTVVPFSFVKVPHIVPLPTVALSVGYRPIRRANLLFSVAVLGDMH